MANCNSPPESEFEYDPLSLNEEHDWNAHNPPMAELEYHYDWMRSNENASYIAVTVNVRNETKYHLTVNEAVYFDDVPAYWSTAVTIRNMTDDYISKATGGGTVKHTTCTNASQQIADCSGLSGYYNASSSETGRLRPGYVVFTAVTYGSAASSILMNGSFSSPVELVDVNTGEVGFITVDANVVEGRAHFESSFTLDHPALVTLETYRTPFEGPVEVTTPDENIEFHRSSFGWETGEGVYFERKPHFRAAEGDYTIHAQAGAPDNRKPALLLVGIMYEPDFLDGFRN